MLVWVIVIDMLHDEFMLVVSIIASPTSIRASLLFSGQSLVSSLVILLALVCISEVNIGFPVPVTPYLC